MKPAKPPVKPPKPAKKPAPLSSLAVAFRHIKPSWRHYMDYAAAAEALNEAQKRIIARAPGLDWDHRTVDQISPPSFPTA